jgi:1,2-diacylglycerol 3-beta-galactosyltransferase
MAASDLLLTKAGPGSLAEALLKVLPLIIMSYVPGQEEGNVRWAEMENFGKYVKDPADIADVVEKLMRGETLTHMREAILKIRNPQAVFEIVDLILHHAERSPE